MLNKLSCELNIRVKPVIEHKTIVLTIRGLKPLRKNRLEVIKLKTRGEVGLFKKAGILFLNYV